MKNACLLSMPMKKKNNNKKKNWNHKNDYKLKKHDAWVEISNSFEGWTIC